MVRNRLISILIALMLIMTETIAVFADGSDISIYNKKYYSDYSTLTTLGSTSFDPDLNISVKLNNIDWLGIPDLDGESRSGVIKIKTGTSTIDLNKKMPNLKKYALAQEHAQTALVGYTFTCNNIGGTWNTSDGKWVVKYNDPKARVRLALAELSNYISSAYEPNSVDMNMFDEKGNPIEWFNNQIILKKNAVFQLGNEIISTKGDVTIDDLYDPNRHHDDYSSSFAYCMSEGIKPFIEYSSAADNKIQIHIPRGSLLLIANTKIKAIQDIDIDISTNSFTSTGSLKSFYDSIGTATTAGTDDNITATTAGTDDDEIKWNAGNKCDADAIINSCFSISNDLVGVLAEKDTVIKVCDGEAAEPSEEITTAKDICAEINVTAGCKHTKKVVKDKIAPTITTYGYSGDVYCGHCGIMLSEGDVLAKLPSTIKLNVTSLKMKVKQSATVLKVTFKKGDRIKSVTSSKTSVVKAAKSGTNMIKLTAVKKGKATVTVKLAGGKSAKCTVTVQKGDVKCTGLTITNGTSVKLKKGKSHTIKTTTAPLTCTQKVTYKSSNKKIATVSSKGKVKAKKKGKATITVKCGKKTKKVKITVK